jgi:hypothetical protein
MVLIEVKFFDRFIFCPNEQNLYIEDLENVKNRTCIWWIFADFCGFFFDLV